MYKGTFKKGTFFNTAIIPVAIKVFASNYDDSVLTDELRNMGRLMKSMGKKKPPNLVTFIGACFQTEGYLIDSLEKLPDKLLGFKYMDSLAPPSILGRVSIVMELCENGSLLEYLQSMKRVQASRPFSIVMDALIQQIHTWTYQIATGMEYLASHNVKYCD